MDSLHEARRQLSHEERHLTQQLNTHQERIDHFLQNNDFNAVHAAADAIRTTAELAVLLNASQVRPVSLPGLPVHYYYMGLSDVLGRLKFGITKNLVQRQAAVRQHMAFLGFRPDFEMFEWSVGEAREVRVTELRGLKLLSPYSRGGEWFDPDVDEVWEWQFTSARHLDSHLRQRLRDFNVELQLREALTPYSRSPLFRNVSIIGKSPERSVADQMACLWTQWGDVHQLLTTKDWNEA